MKTHTRRDFLKTTSGIAASAALDQSLLVRDAAAQQLSFKPESGAALRVLRWKRFVQGDEEQWMANTRAFTERTGVSVRVDSENFEDIRPKAAVAASVANTRSRVEDDFDIVWVIEEDIGRLSRGLRQDAAGRLRQRRRGQCGNAGQNDRQSDGKRMTASHVRSLP